MRALVLALALSSLQGCATYVGIAMNDQEHGRPEIDMDNPIGIIGTSYKMGPIRFFAEHHSGMLYRERGLGYNLAGIKLYLTDDSRFPWEK